MLFFVEKDEIIRKLTAKS